jgi:hypothetical protein
MLSLPTDVKNALFISLQTLFGLKIFGFVSFLSGRYEQAFFFCRK